MFFESGGGGGGWIFIVFENCIFSGKINVFGGVSNKMVGGVGFLYFYNKYIDFK